MTHDDLVDAAARWLRGTRKCSVVLAELTSSAPMTPDAIGWEGPGWWGVLVEAKTSRSDFRADAKKPHRRMEGSPGQERWYLTPPGLLDPGEVPSGWGLLETSGKRVTLRKVCPRTRHPPYFRHIEPDLRAHNPAALLIPERQRWEMALMWSALRRHQAGASFDSKRSRFTRERS